MSSIFSITVNLWEWWGVCWWNMKIGAVGDMDIEERMPRRAHIRHYDHYASGHIGGY